MQCKARQSRAVQGNDLLINEIFIMKTTEQQETLQQLINAGQFDYGDTYSIDEFLKLFGFSRLGINDDLSKYSAEQLRDKFQKEQLAILNVYNIVSQELLKVGKYIKQDKGVYRICLPSENADIADSLMKGAQRKIGKARKLLKNTSPEFFESSNIGSRLLLAEQSTKKLIQ